MARNDSVQVRRLLQPDFHGIEKPSDKYHQTWKDNYFSSSPGTSDSESPQKTETNKPQQMNWDSSPDLTSCCPLNDLKRISHIKRILGPLEFDSRHAVLVDVRTRSCQTCLCSHILVSSGRLCVIKDISCPSSGVHLQQYRRNRAPARQRQMDEKLCEVTVLALKHIIRGFNPKGV